MVSQCVDKLASRRIDHLLFIFIPETRGSGNKCRGRQTTGNGDGDTVNDIVIVDDDTFQLRAERAGSGDGRVYTITYEVTDACGNSTLASATVNVPKSK